MHRHLEVVGRRVDVAAGQLVAVGEGDAVDDEVEAAPFVGDRLEDRVHRGVVGDVAMADHLGTHLLGERAHALAQRFALVGEGQLRALRGRLLGDPVSNRAIVGDAEHEPALACQQSRALVRHELPARSSDLNRPMSRTRHQPRGRRV